MSVAQLSSVQSEVMNLMSFIKTESTFVMMKQALSDFFEKEAEKELKQMWSNGQLSDARIEEFRNLHERTPYN